MLMENVHNVKVVLEKVQIEKIERENILNVKVVFENVWNAKN